MELYPIKLKPVIKEYIWGTEKWIVSTHPDGLSVVDNGEFKGQTLRDVLGDGLPILIKHITARDATSIQVHPDDSYAKRAEGQRGKNEMWYVLDAEPDAEMILGLREPAEKDTLRALIESGGIMSAVNRVPVKAGECYCIPAGMLHTFGKGITIVEVQQSSNVTYRVYDYGRVDSDGNPRELHIDKALDVIDVSLSAKKTGASDEVLSDWEHFSSKLVEVTDEGYQSAGRRDKSVFECLVVLCNSGSDPKLQMEFQGGRIDLHAGEAVFIPAGMADYTLAFSAKGGQTPNCKVRVMAVSCKK